MLIHATMLMNLKNTTLMKEPDMKKMYDSIYMKCPERANPYRKVRVGYGNGKWL